MTNRQSNRTFLWLSIFVAAVFAIALWQFGPMFLRSGGVQTTKPNEPATTSTKAPNRQPWKTNPNASGPAGQPGKDAAPEATPVLDAWMERNWEEDDGRVIDGLLAHAGRSDLGLAEKNRAMEHALNLLPDTEYQKLDALLTAPSTSPHLLQQVFTDLHNRSEKASLHASLRLLARPEPEVADAAKGFLAHWVDLDEESDTEAIRLQAETRLIELEEEEPPPPDHKEQDPKAPIPPGLRDAALPEPEE